MRLLRLSDNGELSLIERSGGSIPEYAILSHTWGPDGDEVTYEDLIEGTANQKPGYKKIQFCGNQAKNDGLQYFWIDTCCINKANFTELSEAINSMFRWYRDATRCYVYLSDVPNPHDPTSTMESAFPHSRWFERGWTLQELIAPSSVQFFSYEGRYIGSKKSREQQIYQITGVAIEALQGSALSQFSTSKRLSWAEQRQTTVEEDAAYCLLGIFDIQMPLIYGEGRQKAWDRLLRKIHKSQVSPVVPAHVAWTVPFDRNPRFTGRDPLIAQLEAILFARNHTARVAIMGLGGVGKTQLVLELLYRIKEKEPDCSIIWILATNEESIHQAYLEAAQQLGIPGSEDNSEDVKRVVQRHLSQESTGRWLLVYDNADDIDPWITKAETGQQPGQDSRPLIDYLPKSKYGTTLVTTRDRRLAVKLAQQNVVEVPAMGQEAAAQLLKKCLLDPKLVESQKDTSDLLLQLTYLPLAIVQAAAYINENGIVIADYLSLLGDQEEEVIDLLSEEFEDEGRYRAVKNPVATTWLISFDQIRQRNYLAAEYLSLLACVEPKDIPQALLPPGPTRKKEIDAIGTLTAYSFITRRPADMALDLHRLVHLATRNWLRKEKKLTEWTEKAIARLEEVFPDDSDENRSVWRMYLTHVRYALESDLVDKEWNTRIELMQRYAMCLYEDGRWDEAEIPIAQVLKMKQRTLGTDHPDTLTILHNLALNYRHRGRWDEAERLQLQVLETNKKNLGIDHPHTLINMNQLGLTYREQGRLEAAEELHSQVVEISKKKLGEDHPDSLNSMHNLALTYRDRGRFDEAEQLQVQVVEASKRHLGIDHSHTLISINQLAATYRDQGRLDQAEELHKQVVEISKKKLGPDHPDTLTSMVHLASTYWDQGRLDAAEELELQTLEIRKNKLGVDHPDSLNIMHNLAFTWREQGRDMEAIQLMSDCVERRRRILGVNHPDFVSSTKALTGWEGEDAEANILAPAAAEKGDVISVSE